MNNSSIIQDEKDNALNVNGIPWIFLAVDHSGTICSVLGGIVVTAGTCCMVLFSSGVVVPVGVGIAIGVVAVGAVVSGVSYLTREHVIRTEQERRAAITEITRLAQLEEDQHRAVNAAKNIGIALTVILIGVLLLGALYFYAPAIVTTLFACSTGIIIFGFLLGRMEREDAFLEKKKALSTKKDILL